MDFTWPVTFWRGEFLPRERVTKRFLNTINSPAFVVLRSSFQKKWDPIKRLFNHFTWGRRHHHHTSQGMLPSLNYISRVVVSFKRKFIVHDIQLQWYPEYQPVFYGDHNHISKTRRRSRCPSLFPREKEKEICCLHVYSVSSFKSPGGSSTECVIVAVSERNISC